MSDWKVLKTEVVYETPWIKVHRDEVLNHNAKQLTYSWVELRKPSVFIVAVNPEGKILLHRNYRYLLDQTMWEIPAGYADEVDYLAAAKRELCEEAGLQSDDWTQLGTLYQANGIGKIPFHVFLARNAQHATDERDPDEEITDDSFVELIEIERMIANGEIIESAHIAALYLAKLHGLTKEDK